MFKEAAKKLGYHPFPNPSACVSRAWKNPYGNQIAPCNYCGYCSKYPCLNYSKASPQTAVMDALKRMPNFSYEVHAEVYKVVLHDDGKTAKGVLISMSTATKCSSRRRFGALQLPAVQRAPDAAVRHRQALQPDHRRGRRRA